LQNLRHGRAVFVRSPATPAGTPLSVPGSIGLGVYQTGGFSRFVGMFIAVGSATLQYRMGVHSGAYQVSSAVVINSGNSILDVLNYGLYADFAFTASVSQAPRFVIIGEPVR
jgi:hypothetical protein